MDINKLNDGEIADVILNPGWWEPECSVLHNLWSNLEFVGMSESNPRYDSIIELAERKHGENNE
jgi:hypothetical protein